MIVYCGRYCQLLLIGASYKLAVEKIRWAGMKISSKNSKDTRIPVCVAAIILPLRTSPTNGLNTTNRNSAIKSDPASTRGTFYVYTSITILYCTIANTQDIVDSHAKPDFVENFIRVFGI